MYARVYFNYEADKFGRNVSIQRGYKHGDRMLEVWDGTVDIDNILEASDYIFNYINNLDEISPERLLGVLAMRRGDVVYYPDTDRAYARTISGWKKINSAKFRTV